MLQSMNSAQISKKDEQGMVAVGQNVAQRDGSPVNLIKPEFRRRCAFSDHFVLHFATAVRDKRRWFQRDSPRLVVWYEEPPEAVTRSVCKRDDYGALVSLYS
jgi:hypothetical protein